MSSSIYPYDAFLIEAFADTKFKVFVESDTCIKVFHDEGAQLLLLVTFEKKDKDVLATFASRPDEEEKLLYISDAKDMVMQAYWELEK